MAQTRFVMPVGRRCDSEGYPKAFDGFRSVTPGKVQLAKNGVTLVDKKLIVVIREEADRTGYGFLGGVELVISMQ